MRTFTTWNWLLNLNNKIAIFIQTRSTVRLTFATWPGSSATIPRCWITFKAALAPTELMHLPIWIPWLIPTVCPLIAELRAANAFIASASDDYIPTTLLTISYSPSFSILYLIFNIHLLALRAMQWMFYSYWWMVKGHSNKWLANLVYYFLKKNNCTRTADDTENIDILGFAFSAIVTAESSEFTNDLFNSWIYRDKLDYRYLLY